jgi:hypothetical protein
MDSLICYELKFIHFMRNCIRFMDYSLDLARNFLHFLLVIFILIISEVIIYNSSIGLQKWRGRELAGSDMGEMPC